MVKKYQGYDAMLIRRMRITLTIITWIVWGAILFLQHDWIISILTKIFK